MISGPLHARDGPVRYLTTFLLLTGNSDDAVIAIVGNCGGHADVGGSSVLVAHCEQNVGVTQPTL